MREKERKRRMAIGTLYDQSAMETYLEKMAQKGWMLKGSRGICWNFEKCEPKKVRFQVDCFDKASNFDSNPEKATQEYIEYCEAGGWKYIHSMGKMQIFYTEDMEIPEIQTDDKMKLKSMFKGVIWLLISWLMLAGMQLVAFLGSFLLPLIAVEKFELFGDVIANSARLGLGLMNLELFLIFWLVGIRMIWFFVRNGIRVRKGEKIKSFGYKSTRIFYGVIVGWIILCLALLMATTIHSISMLLFVVAVVIVLILVVVGYNFLTTRKWANRENNIIVAVIVGILGIVGTFAISFGVALCMWRDGYETVEKNGVIYSYATDELPITIGELGYEKDENIVLYEESDAWEEESIFAKKEEYVNYYMLEEDIYHCGYKLEIFRGSFSWVTEKYNHLLLNDPEYEIIEAPDWAQELWQQGQVYILKKPSEEKICVITEGYTLLLEGVREQKQVKMLKEAYGL